MKCYIFCSADIESYSFLEDIDFADNYVICADGGYKHALKLGIVPDLWLGDSDSLAVDEKTVNAKEKLHFPSRKDNTDTDLAIEAALERGFREIVILGGIGGRLDHEYSHFCLLKKILLSGGVGTLLNEKNEITMTDKSFKMYPSDKKYISFFPFGDVVENFSIKGLRYEAENITLTNSEPCASSNCFDDEKVAEITFSDGYVLVIRAND